MQGPDGLDDEDDAEGIRPVPQTHPTMSASDVARHVGREVFDGPGPHDRTGIELEWLLSRPADRRARIPRAEIDALLAGLGPLAGGSRVTVEPGGQIELAGPPLLGSDQACTAAAGDLFRLDAACRAHDLELVALGADPLRGAERVTVEPRYRAMQDYFDDQNACGRTMMCNTASLQVNVGLGPEGGRRARWDLLNSVGPVLLAAFANSPFANGAPSGWVSTRFRAWWGLDPSRAGPIDVGGDPVESYSRYALDARVMLIRVSDDDFRPLVDPLSFEQWMTEGHELGWPDRDDLRYHLTTLFPPVRPRGWFELRMIDALPTPFWQIAVSVVAALVEDPAAAATAAAACAGLGRRWADAAQLGLGHPEVRAAAEATIAAAVEVVDADDLPVADAATAFLDRYTRRGRAPADDLLDAWRDDGTLYPPPLSPLLEGAAIEARR